MLTLTRGVLIALEGIDGSGKTSLMAGLTPRLQNVIASPIITTKEPGGTALGKQLRTLLQEHPIPISSRAEFLLFAADRAQHMHELVIPAFKKNALVISDRMADSSLVYQGYGRGLDRTFIATVNTWAMQHYTPTLTLYLKISAPEAYERMRQRNEKITIFEQEKQAFFERLIHGFDTLYHRRTDVITLESSQPMEQVIAQAFERIMSHIPTYVT